MGLHMIYALNTIAYMARPAQRAQARAERPDNPGCFPAPIIQN